MVVASRIRRVGLVLNVALASCWTLLAVVAAGVGGFYLIDGLVSDAFLHELGVAVGVFLLIGAGIGASLSIWMLRSATRALRAQHPGRTVQRLMNVDLLGACGSAWLLLETFKTASGDGHSPNPLYVTGWLLSSLGLAAAGVALLLSRRDEQTRGRGEH